MAERALTKMQYGLESVHGTAVAADTMLVGEHQPITVDRQPQVIEEDIGVRAKGYRTRPGDVLLVTDTLRFPNAYFQLLPVLFSCGLKGGVTPAEQSSGQNDYLWDFTPSMTGGNTPNSMTLELGDDVDAVEREYLMFDGLRMQFDVPQAAESAPVVIEGTYFARQNTKTAFTGALSLPVATPISGKLFRMYRDSAWASVGNTEKTGLLRGLDLQIMTGLHHKLMAGANRYFDYHGEGEIGFVATYTFEGNAEADLIYDAMISNQLDVLRLAVEGPQIGSGDNHRLQIDLGGMWRDVVKLSSEDRGNNLCQAILEGYYDPAGAKMLGVEVTTNISAV